MSAFCGAWSLSGEPIERLLGLRERRSMLEAAGSGPESITSGPLWSAASRGHLAEAGSNSLAWAGYLSRRAEGFNTEALL